MLCQATKEFVQSQKLLDKLLQIKKLFFEFKKQNAELKKFIKANYTANKTLKVKSSQTTSSVFTKKMVAVMPSIRLDWRVLKTRLTKF